MWRWLYSELRSAIIDGRLKSGARLPSTRNLAAQYGLARGTVVAAFQQLQAEGFVSSEVSAGTFVVPASEWEMTSPTRVFLRPHFSCQLRIPSVRRFGATSRLSTCFQSNCGRELRRAFIAKHRVLCMGKVMQVVIRHCEEPSRNMWATPAEYVVLLNRSS